MTPSHSLNRLPAMLPTLMLMFFLAGCGKDTTGISANDTEASQPTANIDPTPLTRSTPQKPARPLKAAGQTDDGKTVTLETTVSDTAVSGTIRIDARTLQVQGMLDGDTLRCWLIGSDQDTFRGTLIGTEKNNSVEGAFIVSSNAGDAVIKGSLIP